MKSQERYYIGNRVSKITIIINILLSIIKITLGVIGNSAAMISDGVHSSSDVVSTIAVIIGLKMSSKPPDKDHPYGHEKMEPIMAKILAGILMITATLIGYRSINIIKDGNFYTPGVIAIYAAIISIVVKEWMYWYTIKAAEKLQSTVLKADAWHHRSDAFSSIGTLIGIIGARFGYKILDPIASLVVCIFIFKIAFQIYKSSINQLVDHAADDKTVEDIRQEILKIDGVLGIDMLKTRLFANKMYVDVEISVNKSLSLCDAHNIAEKVHLNIEKMPDNVIHCMVHVNPA